MNPHDYAVAASQHLLEVVASAVHPCVHRDLLDEFYAIIVATIAAYEHDRRPNFQPSRN